MTDIVLWPTVAAVALSSCLDTLGFRDLQGFLLQVVTMISHNHLR